MDDQIASIWFSITGRGRRTLTVAGIYHEHSYIDMDLQVGEMNPSKVEAEHIRRWELFVKQWTDGNQNGSCLVIGDINLDKKLSRLWTH